MDRRIVAAAVLSLSGCGAGSQSGDVSLTNASVEEVAASGAGAGAGAARFEPGEWETTITVEGASIPGMPAGMVKEMERLNLAKTTVRNCMSPEQAAKPDEAVFAGKGGNCRFDRYVLRSGKLDATMRCNGGETPGGEAVITMKGRFDRTSFNLTNSMTAAPVPGHPEVAMTSRVIGKRIGACKA
jgi:hypothetical protein